MMPDVRLPGWKVLGIVLGFLLGTAGLVPASPKQEPSAPPAQQEAPPAEEEAAPPPINFWGTTSFGYRFLDLNGNQAKYNELLNLQQGFRVFDTQLNFRPRDPNRWGFDRLSLTTQGLGGDPYPVLRADLRKSGVYELRAGYRTAQYYYDLPQTDISPHRGWRDRRRFADAELRYTPTPDWRFRFFYNRTEREGRDLSTGPFFYLPQGRDVWGAFGRPDLAPWIVPIREEANWYGAGIDYRWRKTNFHVEQSYRTYSNPANLRRFPNQPVELLGPTSPQQNLILSQWDTFSSLNIPSTSLRVDQDVLGRLHLRAGYVYSHASGPASLTGALQSHTVNIGGTQIPEISLNLTGAGTTNLTTHTSEVGLTLKILESLDLISDYRYQILSQKGTQTLSATRSDFPDPVLVAQEESLRWDFGMHTLDTLLAFVPRRTLSIRAGLRFFKEDIVRKEDGRVAPGTRRSWSYTPVINVAWTPSRQFSLRGEFQSRTAVDPYVRISPQDTLGSTIRLRYSPGDLWGIDNTWSFRNWETEEIGFRAHSRSNSTTLWFQPFDQLGFQGGFNYGNFSSRGTIAFLRGVPPLTGFLSTDQTIDRNFFLGVKANPKGSLTLSFTGQFIRSTGLGAFTGERSVYGPLTWPAWTAEIAHTLNRVGRVAFSWQRSYYHEDLARVFDYSANGFTLRFERSF